MLNEVQGEQSYFKNHPDEFLGNRYTCNIGPIEYYSNDDVISILFIQDTYTEGGNHHNYGYCSFNYNVIEEQELRFDDLVSNSSEFNKMTGIDTIYHECDRFSEDYHCFYFGLSDSTINIYNKYDWPEMRKVLLKDVYSTFAKPMKTIFNLEQKSKD